MLNSNRDALNDLLDVDLEDLKIKDSKLFKIGAPFERQWYNINDKSSKSKLGKLYHATLKNYTMGKEKACICRIIDLERISAYTIESFENRIKKLTLIKAVDRFWFMPLGYHIDDKLKVTLFYPQSISLYQLLHSDDPNLDKIL